jgi:RNase P subunit RPR2
VHGAVRTWSYHEWAVTLCALCRRNLLAGERFRYWRSAEARPVARVVCHVCEPEAGRGGWVRAADRRAERENAVGLRGTVRLVA